MNRKDFLDLMMESVKLNLVTSEDEEHKALSVIHGLIIETLRINEHLDIFDIEKTMKDEAMVYIIDETNEELVRYLLDVTGKLYLKDMEEGECLI